ncbi:MAG: LysM peptidoglycan-binding domain-containing M23 family metallopeptidase [Acuticoccus sp.]
MSRLVLTVAMAGLAAGCSSGNVRLAGSPLFASNPAEPTALAPVETSTLPPAAVAPGSQLTTSASLKAKGYTLENAPIIEVGAADTANSLATGYGVPVDVILEANGLTSIAEVRPGQRLVIPRAAPPATSVAAQPAQQLGAPPTTLNQQAAESRYTVQYGDTLWSISTKHGASPEAVRTLNGLPANGSVMVGQTLRIPAPAGAAPATTAQPALATNTQPANTLNTAPAQGYQPATAVANTPAQAAPTQPVQSAALQPTQPPAVTQNSAPAASGFRWPVQGRILTGFGKQADGARNDGINLAVPAGTPVLAAESGTVIYAGNELEGYGNLILVQHADDWVSAYAHAETITVSRGQKVSRGQAIANVGKTGSVDQPQLHFELRKKSKPVDPLPHLAGA